MDEISLLRRTRDDIPERTPEEVTRGRAALFQAIDGESPLTAANRAHRRRQGFAWAGFSALGAGALTVALVAGNVLGAGAPGGPGGADAAAADVLESAAIATLETSDPVVGPGQYLLVQTDAFSPALGGEDLSPMFRAANHDELYLPADRTDDWIWLRCKSVLSDISTPEAQQIAEEFASGDTDMRIVAPGGATYGGGQPIDYTDLSAAPRDPQELLTFAYAETDRQGPSRDGAAFEWVVSVLRQGSVPADLRAALYRAASGIPGVTVTEDQATLNGTTGIAIGRVEETNGLRQDIIIDETTGTFIGEREVAVEDTSAARTGESFYSTAVTTTVVDAAPADTSLCNEHR